MSKSMRVKNFSVAKFLSQTHNTYSYIILCICVYVNTMYTYGNSVQKYTFPINLPTGPCKLA